MIASAITNVEETTASHVEMDITALFLFMKLGCEQASKHLIKNIFLILYLGQRLLEMEE